MADGSRRSGPEAGLHERADQPTICGYYDDLLADRMIGSGRVEFFAGCDYVGDRTFVSRDSGERFEVPEHCRIVDARYLAPDIPAETPPRFGVADGARVIPVNDLVRLGGDTEPVRDRRLRARPRPTPASGCSAAASTPTRSAGCGRASRGC